MDQVKQIQMNGASPLFNKNGMFHKTFASDFRQIRYYTLLILQKAPPEFKEINLLEQQVSELIKNAVKHGNKSDASKNVDVWFQFTDDSARLIVQDQGEGFTRMEEWNEFNRQRTACFQTQDFERMAEYVSFITPDSDGNDSGNALFAALEYWDGGVVLSDSRTSIAVAKNFPRRRHGIALKEG